jgi:DNA-binding NarL/FixJ family response regulator
VTAATEPITVLAADDHPLILAGLRAVLAPEPDMALVGEAPDGAVALALYRERRPDVVLMDLRMPVMDGVAATRALLAEFPEARVIVLTANEADEEVFRALCAGARGYLVKDAMRAELLDSIRAVHRGHPGIPAELAARLAECPPSAQLTPAELEVLRAVARGLDDREIAAVLGREERAVAAQLRDVLAKLDADDRTTAVVVAIRRGLLRVE